MKMIEEKKEDAKMKKYEKWNYCESIPLRCLLSTYNRLTFWRMAKNMAMNETENKQIHQFQVRYM